MPIVHIHPLAHASQEVRTAALHKLYSACIHTLRCPSGAGKASGREGKQGKEP